MQGGAKPAIRRVKAGPTLVRQGETGSEVFLLLDGVLRVEEDGKRLAEYGPGALLGERAHLEGGRRTSTLVAVTPCRVAAVEAARARSRSAARAVQGSPPDTSRPELSRLRIHLCGVRGSTPAPGIDFVRYGGHTSCLALAHDGAAGTDPDPRRRRRAAVGLEPVRRRAVHGHDPSQPPALGSRARTAVLRRRATAPTRASAVLLPEQDGRQTPRRASSRG